MRCEVSVLSKSWPDAFDAAFRSTGSGPYLSDPGGGSDWKTPRVARLHVNLSLKPPGCAGAHLILV